MTVALPLSSFVLIVGGAIVSASAVEWPGRRLDLGGGCIAFVVPA
jgi:hypothetical protein